MIPAVRREDFDLANAQEIELSPSRDIPFNRLTLSSHQS
jgi:hypothetical protein